MISHKSGHKLDEKGIALVTVLVLSAIALALMAGLIFVVMYGTQISGLHKRYKTALEASRGGANISLQVIGHDTTRQGGTLISIISSLAFPSRDVGGTHTDCLTPKLTAETSTWPAECSRSLSIDPATQSTYDWRFELPGVGSNNYEVYAKIVDTVRGNSGPDEALIDTGVVREGAPGQHVPFLYSVEVSTRTPNAAERAKLSILYQY